ncbi:MAG TPA: DnaJ domain-containing protein [Microbacterium sp.]|uniref:J domain-containing protein n=1 Tax=Microbacterium sp. TaxID=51671 RepID=UPI002B4A4901|nr:DnaJ domain-containing protein [Microbacterium sp.]HKT57616.1 DnaJ domain-containing protein [Microbacterium sp.]
MFDSPLSASAYEVLRVESTASDDELRRAYRLRLRQTHPDTGGDAAQFVQVQRAWELIGTPQARAAYDRGRGGAATTDAAASPDMHWGAAPRTAAPTTTRQRARSYGQPGGWRRERYLDLIREWSGQGRALANPYDPALVRSAPYEIRRLLADALAEEATARIVADLGMGYTVWHDVAVASSDAKIDHIVLGPSGLYGILSEDFGGPVRVRRGEIVGDAVPGAPIAGLLQGMKAISRVGRLKFGGAIVVLPDEDVPVPVDHLGKVHGMPTAVVARSSLSTVLRRGVDGARSIGGTEQFATRDRLNQIVRFA